MCCCGKPTVNGEIGAYSWDGKRFSTREPDPPVLREGEALIWDLPGRCGGVDAHSHHFQVVREGDGGGYLLRVKHGGGEEEILIGRDGARSLDLILIIAARPKTDRYWAVHQLYGVLKDYGRACAAEVVDRWREAAAEKRIRTRKSPGGASVKVWIEAKTV